MNTGGRQAEKLAFDIAGLYIPAVAQIVAERSKLSEKIADTDEATTKFLRDTFEKMLTGTLDQTAFTDGMQKMLFPDKAAQLQ